jgi:uncharacterized protein YecT (DUF1311 family)
MISPFQFFSLFVSLTASFLIRFSTGAFCQGKPEVLCTSPSGAFRVEMTGERFSSGEGESSGDVWVISTKDSALRAKLPKESSESPLDNEFHFSPNEEWIFGLRHVGSGLEYGNVYHRLSPVKIATATNRKSFNDLAWENCVKLRALRENYSAAGVYAMTSFVCWSIDSGRVLMTLRGGEKKGALNEGYLYFNTRTNKFEVTDYSRKLSNAKSATVACAEPLDPLPSEEELKARLEKIDRQLNNAYNERLKKTEKESVPNLRNTQRAWIKRRDEGVKIYVSLFPAAEKERRRLQFLGDVTAARIDAPPEEWEL